MHYKSFLPIFKTLLFVIFIILFNFVDLSLPFGFFWSCRGIQAPRDLMRDSLLTIGVTKVYAAQPPQIFYEVSLDLDKRVIVGKATFKFFEKKLYIVNLSKARITGISAKNALHQMEEGAKEYLLTFFPSSAESSLDLSFEREFTLRALLEGEYLPTPFPYLINNPFTFELKISLPLRQDYKGQGTLVKAFFPADFSQEAVEDGLLLLKYINKSPVSILPPLIIGPYERETLTAGSLNLNFLITEKHRRSLVSLKNGLSKLVDKVAYVSFSFPNIYLTYGLEEQILPGLILLTVNREYSPQEIVTLVLEHELSFGRQLSSQTLIKGLAIYLGEHELTSNPIELRRRLLLSQDERAYSFYRVFEFAQRVGESGFKASAMEFLSQKVSTGDFVKKYRLEENFPQGEIKVLLPKEIKAQINIYRNSPQLSQAEPQLGHFETPSSRTSGHQMELYLITNNFSSPYELEVKASSSQGVLSRVKVLSKEERIILDLPRDATTIYLDPNYKLYRMLSLEEVPRNMETLILKPLTVVLPDKGLLPLYQPLLNFLRDRNPKVKLLYGEDKLDLFLTKENLLFLHQAPPNYFIDLPQKGFYIKFLPHPNFPLHTIAFAKTETVSELTKALEFYSNWKTAEEVHITKGKLGSIKKSVPMTGITLKSDTAYGLKPQFLMSLDEAIPHLFSSRIILIGEEHEDPAHHKFQLDLIKRLYQQFPKLVIGVEMVQRPFQRELDNFINGKISEESFLKSIEYFERWGYDWRLYREVFLWARENKVKMLALDLPKELVSKVHKLGLQSLTEKETKELPETDFQLSLGYKRYLETVYSQHKFSGNESTFERFYQAQVLRDEAMAETLSEFLSKNPDYKAIVLVGKGHILNRWGLYYALKKRTKQPILSIILGDVPFFSPEIADYVFQPPEVKIKRTPQLGVVLEEVKEGLLIKEVKPGSLAEKIGLKREDVILEINNKRVQKVSDLKLILTFLEDDENLTVRIKRGNREESLRYKPL